MKLRAFGALVCALTLSACTASMNEADYTRIGYGPSFDMAYARCDQRASGVGTGYLAIGSPAFVAGAALGNAIDNAVAQDRYRRNCLAMYGWKRGPRGKGTTAAAAKPGRSQPDLTLSAPGGWVNAAIYQHSTAERQCAAGKKASCATRNRLAAQLRAKGINPANFRGIRPPA